MVNPNLWLKTRALLFSALALGLALAGCGGDLQSGGGGGKSGTLTITNCPAGGVVHVYDANEPTTQTAWQNLGVAIAVGLPDSATSYPLMKITGGTFTDSGNFLVVLMFGAENTRCKKVSFSNGSGTVDYNSMTVRTSLPQ